MRQAQFADIGALQAAEAPLAETLTEIEDGLAASPSTAAEPKAPAKPRAPGLEPAKAAKPAKASPAKGRSARTPAKRSGKNGSVP